MLTINAKVLSATAPPTLGECAATSLAVLLVALGEPELAEVWLRDDTHGDDLREVVDDLDELLDLMTPTDEPSKLRKPASRYAA